MNMHMLYVCPNPAILGHICTANLPGVMAGPAKAMGFGVAVFAMLIVSVLSVSMPKLSGIAGGVLPGAEDILRAGGNNNNNKTAVTGISELAKKNIEMTEVMRQQVNSEAQAIVVRCLEEGDACQQLGLLKEICGSSSNILKLESCNDPRVAALLAKVSE
jgi:hypothetical protein